MDQVDVIVTALDLDLAAKDEVGGAHLLEDDGLEGLERRGFPGAHRLELAVASHNIQCDVGVGGSLHGFQTHRFKGAAAARYEPGSSFVENGVELVLVREHPNGFDLTIHVSVPSRGIRGFLGSGELNHPIPLTSPEFVADITYIRLQAEFVYRTAFQTKVATWRFERSSLPVSILSTRVDSQSERFEQNTQQTLGLLEAVRAQQEQTRRGGSATLTMSFQLKQFCLQNAMRTLPSA